MVMQDCGGNCKLYFSVYVFHLPVMDPSLDEENDDDRSRAHDVQYKGGHGVGVVGPVDGLVAAEESILVWLTDECKN